VGKEIITGIRKIFFQFRFWIRLLTSLSRGRWARVFALAVAYLIAAKSGLFFRTFVENGFATLLWIPTGLSLAVLVLGGLNLWPGVLLGSFIFCLTDRIPFAVALPMACGNAMEAWLGAWMLMRAKEFSPSFTRVVDVFRLLVYSAILATLMSATLGTFSMWLFGMTSSGRAIHVWRAWWLGDSVSAVFVAPFIMVWLSPSGSVGKEGKKAEALAFAMVLIGTAWLTLSTPAGVVPGHHPFGYVLIPVLAWAALRFGQRGAVTVSVVAVLQTIIHALGGLGGSTSTMRPGIFVLFAVNLLVVASTPLVLAAVLEERRNAREKMKALLRSETGLLHQISASRDQLRDFFMRAPALISIHRGPDFIFELSNTAFQEACGGRDFSGLSLFQAMGGAHSVKRIHEIFVQVYGTGRSFSEKELAIDQGWLGKERTSVKYFNTFVQPTYNEAGEIDGVITSSIDVTEQVLLRNEDKKHLMALESANRTKDLFLAALSHELRTPLTTILAWSQILRTRNSDPALSSKGLSAIEASAKAQEQMITDLLEFSKMEAGRIILDKTEIPLVKEISEWVEAFRPIAEKKRVELKIESSLGSESVVADALRLKQMVSNLLVNAIKFSKADGTIWLSIHEVPEKGFEISVRDEGIGFSAEFAPKLFQRFSQHEGQATRVKGSLGLGLFIAQTLAKMHGWEIRGESPGENLGAKFTISIPLDRATEQPGLSRMELNGFTDTSQSTDQGA
jgi:signal transduction histidine kinase